MNKHVDVNTIPEIMTLEVAARVASCSVKTLRRAIESGRLPSRPIGTGTVRKKRVLLREDLQKFLAPPDKLAYLALLPPLPPLPIRRRQRSKATRFP